MQTIEIKDGQIVETTVKTTDLTSYIDQKKTDIGILQTQIIV